MKRSILGHSSFSLHRARPCVESVSNRQPRADERANTPRGFSRFRHILAACIATRLAVDTTTQLFFPFLQTVALGLSSTSWSWAVLSVCAASPG